MSEDYNDYRSEIEMWADMWDQAQEDDIHPAPESPQPSEFAAGVLGLDDAQDSYWDYIDTEEQLLQEDRKIPNPIHPDSTGPDHGTTPAVWVNEDMLKEIESLKEKLFKVENDMAKMGAGEKLEQKAKVSDGGKMMSEIESLRKRIEKVSSSLGIDHEESPWVVKEN
jgi:hypothetical protein